MTGGGGLNQQLKYLAVILTSVPMSLVYVRNNLNQTLARRRSLQRSAQRVLHWA